MGKEISVTEVRHMAQLSRLLVSASEEEQFAGQFGKILGYMEVLNQVDTASVVPLYSPSQEASALRLDEACNTRSHEQILANAPVTDGQCFIVPRIIQVG